MAELPVESGHVNAAIEAGEAGGNWLRGFAGLPIIRQIGLMLALAASVAVGFSVVLWMKDPGYKPLTEVQSSQQASEVAQALQSSGIPYRIDDAETCGIAQQFEHLGHLFDGSRAEERRAHPFQRPVVGRVPTIVNKVFAGGEGLQHGSPNI